jgi:hypothetical protein
VPPTEDGAGDKITASPRHFCPMILYFIRFPSRSNLPKAFTGKGI